MLKLFFLKLLLIFSPLRFYRTEIIPKTSSFKELIFKTNNNKEVRFEFYKETFEDLIYRSGTVNKQKYPVYVIKSLFDDLNLDKLLPYNRAKFCFNNWIFRYIDDDTASRLMLDAYLEIVTIELKEM